MALQSNAALLDELMGKNRNIAPGACINQVKFDDDDVCKYFLVEFCPHDLFVNTRADLGPCNKIHDEELKKQYEKSSRFGRLGYEEDYERFLRSLLSDVERKIKRGNERLKLTQSESDKKTPIQVKQEKVADLKEQINKMIKEAEHLGEEGKIEEAQSTLEECEKLKAECKYIENQLEMALHNQEQKQMEVCNVCGSFLIVNDAQSRVEEHISGKQHMGYAKLRSALDDIRKKRLEELEKREKEREAREKEREKDRDRRDRDRDRDRYRDRSKDRYRGERDRGDRDRDRERDRDRDREKDRERDHERRGDSRRKSSRSPSKTSSSSLSKRNGSSSSSSQNHRDSKDKERDRERDREKDKRSSEHRSKRTRSRSRSKDRSKHHKSDNGENGSSHLNDSKNENGAENGNHKDDSKSRKLEQETDEFLKLVDDLTGSNKKPEKKDNSNDEKEEGEDDDDDMDEGEIRGN